MGNKENFTQYMQIFLEENSKVNLISKNDEKFLWEKHIIDSLAINIFFEKYYSEKELHFNLLDIGTGGGFPAIPIAINFPEIKVYAVDSIAKKIRAVTEISTKLNLKNLYPICNRVENLNEKFDIVTSRAVSSLKNICQYALPKLKNGGYFIAYKSRKADEEIKEAKPILEKYKAKVVDIIEYELPFDEKVTRNLIVINI